MQSMLTLLGNAQAWKSWPGGLSKRIHSPSTANYLHDIDTLSLPASADLSYLHLKFGERLKLDQRSINLKPAPWIDSSLPFQLFSRLSPTTYFLNLFSTLTFASLERSFSSSRNVEKVTIYRNARAYSNHLESSPSLSSTSIHNSPHDGFNQVKGPCRG